MKPNFFVVGTVKAGTTSLYQYLANHPDIYMSPLKEPHYFSTDIIPSKFRPQYRKMLPVDIEEYLASDLKGNINAAFIRNEDQYFRLFKNVRNEKAIGESSTSYLISKVAAQNIYDFNPNAKIIIILRNPTERAYSHYLMNFKSGSVSGPFKLELEKDIQATPKGWGITRLYADHGFYYEQVKRYIDIFGPDKVKIIFTDSMGINTQQTVRDIYRFLNVNENFIFENYERHNVAMIPRSTLARFILDKASFISFFIKFIPSRFKRSLYNSLFTKTQFPAFEEETKNFLISLYREDILKLQKLIKTDLSAWMKLILFFTNCCLC